MKTKTKTKCVVCGVEVYDIKKHEISFVHKFAVSEGYCLTPGCKKQPGSYSKYFCVNCSQIRKGAYKKCPNYKECQNQVGNLSPPWCNDCYCTKEY